MQTATRTRTDSGAVASARLSVEHGRVSQARSCVPLALRRLRDQDDGIVRVTVVQTAAMLLDGDDVRLDVEVGPGAALLLSEISATVAHPMRGGGASWRLSVTAAAGARVVLSEQPLVVARGALVRRDVRIEADDDAQILHRETLVLGRHGEQGGAVCARTRVTRCGRPVLDDTIDTASPAVRSTPAVLGSARVVGSIALFGCDAAPEGFVLGPGDQLVRRLGPDMSALGDLDQLERRWQAAVLGPAAPRRSAA
jgi:urease accessory protein